MTSRGSPELTRILEQIRAGDTKAADDLLPLVYAELRQLARAVFASERRNHTLQPTALIHEAWLKLAGNFGDVKDRAHFYAIAAQAMRRVLTDHARAVQRHKRGGGRKQITLDEQLLTLGDGAVDLVELDSCLERLAALNDRHARLVELRFFAGLTIPETAEVLGVSHTTVERDWFSARAWLRLELESA